jgi:hypothetical protein
MIRTPYIRFYLTPTEDLLCKSTHLDCHQSVYLTRHQHPDHVGNIVLWSNIETAIGLVAGSLPSLRRLVLNHARRTKPSTDNSGLNSAPLGLVTFGGSTPTGRKSRNRNFRNPTDGGVSVATVHAQGNGDWRRLKDDSDKEESPNGIRADYTYQVELSSRQETDSMGSYEFKK